MSETDTPARPRIDIASYMRLTELADYIVPFALRVVCDLRLADELVEGPVAVDELARRTGSDVTALARVLRALASRGIFAHTDDGRVELTPLAQSLRTDHPFSIATCFPLMPPDIGSWGRMDHSLRTGECTFTHVNGEGYYRHLADPSRRYEAKRFELSSESVNPFVLRTVVPVLPLADVRTLVDVGGGLGSFALGLLARHPQLHATVVDQPHVIDIARRMLDDDDNADNIDSATAARCEFTAGDLFEPQPVGADAYLLKTILHDWDDDSAVRILQQVRAAMRADSTLFVIESIRRDEADDEVGTVMDVKAMVLFGGRARSEAEFGQILARAGLRMAGAVQTPTMAVITAEPV